MGCSSVRVTALFFFFSILLLISSANSFYLPGVAPRDFQREGKKEHFIPLAKQFLEGDPLQVIVNKLSSTKMQLPFDYYYLKHCKPDKIVNSAENLGEVLRGDRIGNSKYIFNMREEQPCKAACQVKLGAGSAKNFKEKIDDEYRVNMILDNLPVAVLRQRRDGNQSTTYVNTVSVWGSKEIMQGVMYHRDPRLILLELWALMLLQTVLFMSTRSGMRGILS